ncbi:alpha/beta fold hydrolase [Miltoncostaea marina]|uniref:alpha/beta fold hydrolase n=1 Tax=Miltoncostaea marina TaxID=2843215 RepID=UPI001C3D5D5F|nr:alpha/beta fold hydrolase [Miltoncostaea marina]
MRLSADRLTLRAPGGPELAALAWRAPAGSPGVLVVPGLGSRKDNHADFGEALAAAGMAALALDLRGHGESGGRLDGGARDDVAAGLDALAAAGHAPLGVRGSSMGGLLALDAAARDPRVRAVVAICPARPEGLAGYGERWALAIDMETAVRRDDGVARAYWHATGDEKVPWGSTFALAGATPHPMRLRVAIGGGHRSLQHDPHVISDSVAFLRAHLA